MAALRNILRLGPGVLGAAAGVLLLAGLGCATPEPGADRGVGGGPPDYAATVDALAPTWEPTATPLPTATAPPTETATPPTAQPQPTDTASPTPLPTYTPRPRPTYTPHPLPDDGIAAAERAPGLFFEGTLLDGSEFNMEEATLGTPTLLAFWAPW